MTKFPLDVLPAEEVARIYAEGAADYYAGKQFHENSYAKPSDDVADDDYQRGYEWRRGWNDGALGRALPPPARHSICNDCLMRLGGGDGERARVIGRMSVPCCWCAEDNPTGNTVSAEPALAPCHGVHVGGSVTPPGGGLAA